MSLDLTNGVLLPARVTAAFAFLDRTSPQVFVDGALVDRQPEERAELVRHAALDVIDDFLRGRLIEPPARPTQPRTPNPEPSPGTDAQPAPFKT